MVEVSIVIPAYNEEKYIAKCLDTLLDQSFKNFEIIIVDDDSSDNTYGFVEEYTKNHKNVHLFKQNRGGPGRARNLGASHAKGKIIVLVDSDMEFDKDYIKNLIEPIRTKEAIGTYHMTEYVANKDNLWASCWGTKRLDPKTTKKKGEIFRAILKSEFLKSGGFDPSGGTFDDKSVGEKLGLYSALGVENAICYHNNPTTLGEVFRQAKWIGGSFIVNNYAMKGHFTRHWKLLFLFLIALMGGFLTLNHLNMRVYYMAVLFPLVLVLFTVKRTAREKHLKYLCALPIFYSVWMGGFLYGILVQVMKLAPFRGGYKY